MIVRLNDNDTDVSDVKWWQQERFIIEVTSDEAVLLELHAGDVDVETDTPIATYRLRSGKVAVDVTDYQRTNSENEIFMLYDRTHEILFSVNFYRAGAINPEEMIIPNSDGACLIAPPHMMIEPLSLVRAGFYTDDRYIFARGIEETVNQPASAGYVDVSTGNTGILVTRSRPFRKNWRYIFQEMECEKRYAQVGWTSSDNKSGDKVDRVHTFELRSLNVASLGDFSLLTIDNMYSTIKGREDSFTLYLDNVDEYDIWYYSTILTSSYVELQGVSTSNTPSEPVRLEITDKDIALPNGMTRGKIELKCKYKRYDAVIL